MDSFDAALKQLQEQNRVEESLEIQVSPPQELGPNTADSPFEAPPQPQKVATPAPTVSKSSNLRDALQKLELKTVEQPTGDEVAEGNMPKQDATGIYEITSKEQHAYVHDTMSRMK